MEKSKPFAGASHRSFAWINANHKRPETYHRLNAYAVQEHVRFQSTFPSTAIWLSMSGNILVDFSENRPQTYADRIRAAEEYGSRAFELDREELLAREPAIRWSKDIDCAVFFPDEGYLENDILAEELLKILSARGVRIQRTTVKRVESGLNQATLQTSDGSHNVDYVVVAAGAGSRALAARSNLDIPVADLSVPSARTHSFLGLTGISDIPLKHVVISDRINVRPRHDGRMWVQVPYIEHRVQEGESPELRNEVRVVMEDELKCLFGSTIPVERVILSGRSFPEDGKSIVGYVDDAQRIYAAVTHSGMTLAPLMARLITEELEGGSSQLLENFRPSRFADGIESILEPNFIGRQ